MLAFNDNCDCWGVHFTPLVYCLNRVTEIFEALDQAFGDFLRPVVMKLITALFLRRAHDFKC
jgi:hypothetical protein